MSSTLRSLSKHIRSLSQTAKAPRATRSFHSPFAVLSSSSSGSSHTTLYDITHYEKQAYHAPDPQVSHSGTRTYVVSEPDPSHKPYAVPSGAYPTSAPYISFGAAEAPSTAGRPTSSTSSSMFAHPVTTQAAPQNPSGVGESAAVRHGDAPGEMGSRGGGRGGLGLMDKSSTKPGDGELANRNPAPDGDVAEKKA